MALLPLTFVLALGGCERGSPTAPDDPPDIRPFVTGSAAAALGSDGRFAFTEPVSPSDQPIISRESSRLLAAAYVRSFGSALEPYWEQERGREIDLSTLRPDERAFYASTPYARFPDGYHPAFATAFGPYYVVPMTMGSDPVLLVAVAGYATAAEIDEDGTIQRPVHSGNEFVSQGIPVDTMRPRLASFVSPESAVFTAARLTGAKVSEVPELIRVGLPLGPFSSVWKLTMDRSVGVRRVGDGRTLKVRHVYVGAERGRRLMVPAPEQPRAYSTLAFRLDDAGNDLPPETVLVPILEGRPTVFDEVIAQR